MLRWQPKKASRFGSSSWSTSLWTRSISKPTCSAWPATATGVIPEDVLVFLYGLGSNGKTSWAEAIAHALGDYARVFPPEVLMESKGERHPTEIAQFMGVRFALTSEPPSSATWSDSRIKS